MPPPVIGRTIKNYEIETQLGKGGMGVVYRARDIRLNRPVALKIIAPELIGDEDRRRRFVQEARAASAINHPAIAHIYEIDEVEGLLFIAMEFVEGSTLREIAARGELDLPSAVEVVIQVADALASAHEAGIVHRDIKSDNVMVTKDGHPKILDFGLAKRLGGGSGSDPGGGFSLMQTMTLAHTQAGVIVGTVSYMSPEQARGLPADKRSDIFSFGVVLYEMVAGKLPFEGASVLDTMHAVAFEPAAPVMSIRAEIPWSLQRVIDTCLQKKAEDRYQDLRQAVADLKAVKREVDSGAISGAPVAYRLKSWTHDWTRGVSKRGLLWAGILGSIFVSAAAVLAWNGSGISVSGLVMTAGIGLFLFRRFRNRGQREIRRFVKKVSSMREVRLVAFSKGQFTVVAENPTARTYVKLNALLAAANERLFSGEPMTLVVRENLPPDETAKILSSPGVHFVRDTPSRATAHRPG